MNMKMSDNFFNGLDSDEFGNLIENGFIISRGLDKYKAEAIAFSVSNHDRLTSENTRLREALRKLARASTEVVDISGAGDDVFLEYESALDKSVALLTELEKCDE